MRNSPAGGGVRRVLVIDDEAVTRLTLTRAFESFGCDVKSVADGIDGLAILQLEIDLLVVDAQMPGLDGFEVARRVRKDPKLAGLPILMVTGLGGRADRLRAVAEGINDFIQKPFDLEELRLRSTSLLRMKQATDALKRHRYLLEEKVERRTAALRQALEETVAAQQATQAAHLDTIRRLILAAEHRDHETARHIERIGRYSGLLARALGLSPVEVELIQQASPMHDVGKIGIPDAILRKPGALEPHEWDIMRRHTVMGAEILRGSPSPVLQLGELIALTHHEKWDGSGYPAGLAGMDIPLPARICAVADVYDALTTFRPYRPAMASESVLRLMAAERGRHFDPDVVDAFLANRAGVEAILFEPASALPAGGTGALPPMNAKGAP